MCLRFCCTLIFFCSTSTVWAELAIKIDAAILPRTAEFAALPVTVTIDDVLSSDYDKRETEEDEWERLYLTLPDSDDDELPLHNNADLQNTEGFNRHFWSKAVKREKHNNSSGNLTVVWRFVLKARSGHKLSNLLQGTPPALRLALSYHHWEGEQYGEALLDHLHSFPRLDGVPDEAPQQVQLTPRHHRLHINWNVPEAVDYNNAQGKFTPAGVLAIIAAKSDKAIAMTAAAMVFRTAAEGGDVPLDQGQCQLLPDCRLDCGNAENVYFDLNKIKNINELQKSKLLQGGAGVINGLQPGITYRVVLQYYPNGIKRSACLSAVPVANKTLLELNGADDAKREDGRCFIATAAWGSSRAVADLRWWRDNFLLTNDWGRAFTAFYYRYAPPVAALIADYELLRVLTRILLLVPLAFVLMCKYPLLAMLCTVLFACIALLRNLRHQL